MKKITLGIILLALSIGVQAIGKRYDSNTYEALPTSVSTNAYEFGISYYRNNTVAFFRTDTTVKDINDKNLSKSGIQIYQAKITADGDLIDAQPCQELMNLGVSGAFAYDAKKDKIYFSKYNKTNRVYQLFESHYEGDTWGTARLVEIKGLTPTRKGMSVIENANWDYLIKGASILQPTLAKGGNRIYFSSNLKIGSEGKFDIWYIDYDKENDAWGAPVNVGRGVNTTENEQYPYVLGDSILYYSTTGAGEDGYRLRVARLSNKETLETGDLGDVFGAWSNEYNLLTDGNNVLFIAEHNAKDNIMYLKLKLLQLPLIALQELPVQEEPILQIRTFPWRIFYFDFDRYVLTEEFTKEIDLLYATMLDFMQEHDFTVWGHTDARGSDAYNDALSVRRAKHVANELVKRGIPAHKMQVKGFGKRELAVPNAQTEEEHAQNRRVIVDVVKVK